MGSRRFLLVAGLTTKGVAVKHRRGEKHSAGRGIGTLSKGSRTGLGAAIAFVLMLVALAIGSPSALATNFSGASGGTGCSANNMQDNSTMSYFRSSLTTGMYNAVAYTLNNQVIPTDIALAAEQGSADGNTDVVYFDDDYSNYCNLDWHGSGGGVLGLAECVSLSGSKCQRFDVRFDTSWTDSQTDNDLRVLSCHETGHTLGLLHRDNSGTENGCMPATFQSLFNYSSHDVAHVNANY